MEKLIEISEDYLKERMYIIRGRKVMLDSDLAKIYGYTTKTFNQQVKNNIEKFDDDFRFQLTDTETEIISRSKILTLNNKKIKQGQNIKYNPYVFTEQGIYMLMTVLKGNLAIKQSKALIRLFKSMKDYITENQIMFNNEDLFKVLIQSNEHEKRINNIEKNMLIKKDLSKIMESFSDKNTYREYLILNGKYVEADIAYNNIYSQAKESIYIIDNYVGLKTLIHLKNIEKTQIHIFSSNINKLIHEKEREDFMNEYPDVDIHFYKMSDVIHDRYIILDYNTKNEKIYLSGASSKDAGKKISTIIEISDTEKYHFMIDELIKENFVIT